MATMSFDEVRAAPEKLEPYFKDGKTVTIMKDGKPYFEAVPAQRPKRLNDFDRKIDELWAGTNNQWTTEDVVSLIRQSRE